MNQLRVLGSTPFHVVVNGCILVGLVFIISSPDNVAIFGRDFLSQHVRSVTRHLHAHCQCNCLLSSCLLNNTVRSLNTHSLTHSLYTRYLFLILSRTASYPDESNDIVRSGMSDLGSCSLCLQFCAHSMTGMFAVLCGFHKLYL